MVRSTVYVQAQESIGRVGGNGGSSSAEQQQEQHKKQQTNQA